MAVYRAYIFLIYVKNGPQGNIWCKTSSLGPISKTQFYANLEYILVSRQFTNHINLDYIHIKGVFWVKIPRKLTGMSALDPSNK